MNMKDKSKNNGEKITQKRLSNFQKKHNLKKAIKLKDEHGIKYICLIQLFIINANYGKKMAKTRPCKRKEETL